MSLLLIISHGATSQIQIKIGYDGAYAGAEGINSVLDSYGILKESILNKPISPVHWFHGVNMGARYRYGPMATEFSWESLGNVTTAVEVNGNNATEKQLFFRLNHLSLSQEILVGPAGLGASIDFGDYRIETELNGTSQKRIRARNKAYTSKFFLAFYLRGSEWMSIALKPYYRVHWTKHLDLGDVEEYLGLEPSGTLGEFSHFGISLSFYNGKQ